MSKYSPQPKAPSLMWLQTPPKPHPLHLKIFLGRTLQVCVEQQWQIDINTMYMYWLVLTLMYCHCHHQLQFLILCTSTNHNEVYTSRLFVLKLLGAQ